MSEAKNQMTNFDIQKIHFYVEENKKRNPDFLEVSDETWVDALDSAQAFMSHGDDPEKYWTTETYWMALWTAAYMYCFGFKEGKTAPTSPQPGASDRGDE